MKLNLQFFGGRGGNGGQRLEANTERATSSKTQAESRTTPFNPTVTAPAAPVKPATPAKPKVDKATAFNEKLGKMKTTMTHEQFSKKWGGILKSAPEGTRIWLDGRTWENNRNQTIYVRKISSKEVEVQWGRGDLRTRKIAEFSKLGNTLDNYYVSSARIAPKGGESKTIEFRKKKK